MSAQIIDRLPLLQNLVKRDPEAYGDEFRLQMRAFEAELAILRMNPARDSERLRELLAFLSHVSSCYPKDTEGLSGVIVSLLEEQADSLHPEVRKTMVHCLSLLRSKGMAPALPVLRQLFALFRIQDRALRDLVFATIVMDIRTLHSRGGAEAAATSRALQGYLFGLVADKGSPTLARRSLDVLVQLYRRRVWTGARVVNAIAQGCDSRAPRVLGGAVRFFLGREDEDDEDEDDEDTGGGEGGASGIAATIRRAQQQLPSAHTRATRKRVRKAAAMAARVRAARSREERRGDGAEWDASRVRWPALELLHDPQRVAEGLLGTVRRLQSGGGAKLELRLLCLDLCTRLVGHHRLLVLPLYSYLSRFMSPYVLGVTRILGMLVQACHDLVPPSELAPLLRAIADGFVTEGSANEAMQVGLNTTREVLLRVPLAAREDGVRDLLRDLVGYRKHRDKGVVASAKALIHALQDMAPDVLRKKERGRPTADGAAPLEYGEQRAVSMVEGLELLEEMGLLGDEDEDEAGAEPAEVDSDGEVDPDDVDEDIKEGFRRALGLPRLRGDGDSSGDEEEVDDAAAAASSRASRAEEDGVEEGDKGTSRPASGGRGKRARPGGDDEDGEAGSGSDGEDEGGARRRRLRGAEGQAVFPGEDEAAADAGAAARAARTRATLSQRVLSQRDFDRIRQLKALALAHSQEAGSGATGRARREQLERLRRAAAGIDELMRAPTVDFDPTELEGIKARKRRTALLRAEEDEAARLERKARGGAKDREGGSTNAEKNRKKNFGMLSKSRAVQSKLKMSLREQHKKVRKHIKALSKKTGGPLKRRRK